MDHDTTLHSTNEKSYDIQDIARVVRYGRIVKLQEVQRRQETQGWEQAGSPGIFEKFEV